MNLNAPLLEYISGLNISKCSNSKNKAYWRWGLPPSPISFHSPHGYFLKWYKLDSHLEPFCLQFVLVDNSKHLLWGASLTFSGGIVAHTSSSCHVTFRIHAVPRKRQLAQRDQNQGERSCKAYQVIREALLRSSFVNSKTCHVPGCCHCWQFSKDQ